MQDNRLFSPSVERNRDPILQTLRPHLAGRRFVLEVASGSGEHVAHFAAALPETTFQPTDPNPTARASIDAWIASSGLGNVRPALALDAGSNDWPSQGWPMAHADVVMCINMIHISPWTSTMGLMRGAARVLAPGGLLFLYGPYRRDGRHTAPSNAAFDESLRERDSAWGVRDLEAVTAEAVAAGFAPPSVEEMPANNLALSFRR